MSWILRDFLAQWYPNVGSSALVRESSVRVSPEPFKNAESLGSTLKHSNSRGAKWAQWICAFNKLRLCDAQQVWETLSTSTLPFCKSGNWARELIHSNARASILISKLNLFWWPNPIIFSLDQQHCIIVKYSVPSMSPQMQKNPEFRARVSSIFLIPISAHFNPCQNDIPKHQPPGLHRGWQKCFSSNSLQISCTINDIP